MTGDWGLARKVVAITGGGGVLCSAIGKALAAQGAHVALIDVRPEAAEREADAIGRAGGAAIGVAANVLDHAAVSKAREIVEKAFGPVDILINGAGGNKKAATTSPDLSFFALPPDAIRWVLELNVLGTMIPCQAFGASMAERKQGVILSISSMNAFRPLTRIPAYSAAKAAVSNFTQWLAAHMAQEYGPEIRVNALAPGFFLTEQNRFLLTDEKTGALTPRGRLIIDHTPLGRFGEPPDLIGAALFLVSDHARFITGVVLPVDGGFSAYGGV
jgi:NAD(P)-dependent dehydrogenase (short-subunit alcohol dehydrogenase family)